MCALAVCRRCAHGDFSVGFTSACLRANRWQAGAVSAGAGRRPRAVSTLGYAAAPIPPRPEVRARLLAHIQGMREERAGEDQGGMAGMQRPQRDWTIVRATEGIWEVAGVRGVVTKRLSPVLAQPCS